MGNPASDFSDAVSPKRARNIHFPGPYETSPSLSRVLYVAEPRCFALSTDSICHFTYGKNVLHKGREVFPYSHKRR